MSRTANLEPAPVPTRAGRVRLRVEIALVLGLSLGQSAVYSVVSLLDKLTRAPLGDQTTSMNRSLAERPGFDLTYQLLDIVFALVPVALALYLLFALTGRSPFRTLGFGVRRPGRSVPASIGYDAGVGSALFAAIGVGTLGVYAAGRALGVTTAIVPANLDDHWWTIPVLLLSAVRHGVLEEVVVVGFLFHHLRRLGWGRGAWGAWSIIVASALLRGSYHLYQGIGPFLGNVAMGLVFGWLYQRGVDRGQPRVMPLVVAHALLDAAGFVGYALFGSAIGIGA
ncbi:CPBP family intramembrane glutamic endopeptidase [Zhihengliuella salsuginis]|uniref:CAAX amino protease n=1 Tax=Zhihengliuella salsuginis TaxID=578222 RepID=A0ABQ3GHZ0_9MICC|nr:CPBP family intramembrane glutamic endopeptidase [Zhihengliuella salsuginis]GHD07823.1 CAAX amino protease [Zhihengliuella salsuginis]